MKPPQPSGVALVFPESALTQHVAVLGKTGAGKSSALRHVAEHLLSAGKRVCIIDPKGDWWGLKSTADGKGPGFPIYALGDFKESRASDVPIHAGSGGPVAELIASGNRPCVIGFRGWMTGAMTRFWTDFASTLFNANAGELYLFVDEVHNFAPKGRVMDPEAGKCLHWTNRIMSEGRGVGLVCLIASQRPQKVHNDTLTCCETLVAMRVIHAADRQACADWIDGCGDPIKGRAMLATLAGLPRGDAFVWSPEIGFGPERVTFPMFETFDSFAPPQLQRKVNTSGWGDVDLDDVREKLAAVIEKAEANSPAKLQQRIRELETQLGAKTAAVPERIEVRVFSEADRELLARVEGHFAQAAEASRLHQETAAGLRAEVRAAGLRLASMLPQMAPVGARPTSPASVRSPVSATPAVSGGVLDANLAKAERALLTALAQRNGATTSRAQLALLSGYSITSSSFANALGALRSRGYVSGGGDQLVATGAGVGAVQPLAPLPVGQALRDYWLGKLGKAERTLLSVMFAAHPHAVDKETLAARSGYSITSSSFANALGQLRTLELITRGSEIRATDHLF